MNNAGTFDIDYWNSLPIESKIQFFLVFITMIIFIVLFFIYLDLKDKRKREKMTDKRDKPITKEKDVVILKGYVNELKNKVKYKEIRRKSKRHK